MEVRLEGSIVLYEDKKRVAWVDFTAKWNEIELLATQVEKGMERKGYAFQAVKNALVFARSFDSIKVSCPYIKRWIEENGFDKDVQYTRKLQFKEVVAKFNKYRSPEANAEILEIGDDFAVVKITGPFCVSCGLFDYFEDIAIEANARVIDYEEAEGGFIVRYGLLGLEF
ncbi:MAG: N-acetyltransferase [Archaeoglobales archaeon]|nr:N-acetyltransferase [Archaeoglobales archaeon]